MNPILLSLSQQISSILDDGVIDSEEIQELTGALQAFTGGDSEVTPGELLKTTQLPLTLPKPVVAFEGKCFLFTGTFAYGTRKQCTAAIENLGGTASTTVSKKVDYLVLGTYITPSWKHETFGNKITDALSLMLPIISEEHWTQAMPGRPSHAGPK